MRCYKCQREIPDNSLVCPGCGAEMSVLARSRGGFAPFGAGSQIPMNWYKFIIYFLLFFEAIQYIFTGISYITGYISRIPLGDEGIVVYSISLLGEGLVWVDVLYGAVLLGMAGFAIYARFRLAKFRKNAIWVYLSYLVASGLVSVAYGVVFQIVQGAGLRLIIAYLTELIPQGLMVYLNYIYFNKRKHMFRG